MQTSADGLLRLVSGHNVRQILELIGCIGRSQPASGPHGRPDSLLACAKSIERPSVESEFLLAIEVLRARGLHRAAHFVGLALAPVSELVTVLGFRHVVAAQRQAVRTALIADAGDTPRFTLEVVAGGRHVAGTDGRCRADTAAMKLLLRCLEQLGLPVVHGYTPASARRYLQKAKAELRRADAVLADRLRLRVDETGATVAAPYAVVIVSRSPADHEIVREPFDLTVEVGRLDSCNHRSMN